MYYLTYKGKKTQISAAQFWSMFVPAIIFILGVAGFIVWSVSGGLNMLGGPLLVAGFFFAFLEVNATTNGVERKITLIQNDIVRKTLTVVIGAAAMAYYWY